MCFGFDSPSLVRSAQSQKASPVGDVQMTYSLHIPLRYGLLKIKSAKRLHQPEKDGRLPVWRLGDICFVWVSAFNLKMMGSKTKRRHASRHAHAPRSRNEACSPTSVSAPHAPAGASDRR